MPIYATMVKFSSQEVTGMYHARQALESSKKMAAEMGIKQIGAYVTLGPYDVMLIYEAVDEGGAVGMAAEFGAKWGGRSETWTLIPGEKIKKIVKS